MVSVGLARPINSIVYGASKDEDWLQTSDDKKKIYYFNTSTILISLEVVNTASCSKITAKNVGRVCTVTGTEQYQ